MWKFRDRIDAGQQLAQALKKYSHLSETLILALPRGGVPVAYEICKTLHLPLDIFLVRKLGTPGQEELAMGALAMDNTQILNTEIVENLRIKPEAIAYIIKREQKELDRRNKLYRQNRPFPKIKDQTIILVDDGIATGATMQAAIAAIKERKPKRIVVATPVAAQDTYQHLAQQVDEIICLQTPEFFSSVGQWYENFPQTSDEEVCELLK